MLGDAAICCVGVIWTWQLPYPLACILELRGYINMTEWIVKKTGWVDCKNLTKLTINLTEWTVKTWLLPPRPRPRGSVTKAGLGTTTTRHWCHQDQDSGQAEGGGKHQAAFFFLLRADCADEGLWGERDVLRSVLTTLRGLCVEVRMFLRLFGVTGRPSCGL